MLGNFAHDMGMLAISFSRVDEVVPFIIQEATALGIVVADGQSGELHGPLRAASAPKVKSRGGSSDGAELRHASNHETVGACRAEKLPSNWRPAASTRR